MRIPTCVVIPTRDRIDLLEPLLLTLLEDETLDQAFVFDNSVTQDLDEKLAGLEPHGRLEVVPAGGDRLYEMWNRGWELSLRFSNGNPVNVAILNDDIRVPKDFLKRLAAALREDAWWCVYPDYNRSLADDDPGTRMEPTETRGTFRDGGMCGWAFMMRGDLLRSPLPPIDEEFVWWCGDDDLAAQIELKGGRIGRVNGLACEHVGTATGNLYPELHEQGWLDMERFNKKYAR